MTTSSDLDAARTLIDQIDRLSITHRELRVAQGAMVVSMQYEDPPAAKVREGLLNAVRMYNEVWAPGKLTWWVRDEGKPTSLAKKPFPYDKMLAIARDPEEGFAAALGSGDEVPAKAIDNAQRYQIQIGAGTDGWPGVARLNMNFPMEWLISRPAGAQFMDVIKQLITDTQPLHGTAGIGLAIPQEGGTFQRHGGESTEIFTLVQRYPGIHVDGTLSNKIYIDNISTINWLTVVQDRLLHKIGGRATVEAACATAGLTTFGLGKCLLIQAGPGPHLGDTQVPGAALTHYQAVARLLRPLRASEPRWVANMCLSPSPYGDVDAATAAYLSRFDEHPLPYPK